jgi:methylated-DNA-protein-cysteine methyltransferase-like protein
MRKAGNMNPGSIRQSQRFVSPPGREKFNQQVWALVCQVPVGNVCTYGQIAALIPPPGEMNPKNYLAFAPRWVGGAMAACPEHVPWQRMINAQGKVSIGRQGGQIQRELLEAEGVVFDERERVDLRKYGWSGPEKDSLGKE